MPRRRPRPATNGQASLPPFQMYGGMDALVAHRLRQMQNNSGSMSANAVGTYSARRMIGQYDLDPRVSVEDECGFPPIDRQVNPLIYRSLWERNCIGMRAVDVLPKESWQVQPLIYEVEESDEPTEFEKAWDALGRQLVIGGQGWHAQEHGSPIFEYLLRADILSGIGQYGIIMLGLDDGEEDMRLPVKGIKEVNSVPGIIQRNMDPNSKEYMQVTGWLDMENKPVTNAFQGIPGPYKMTYNGRSDKYTLNADDESDTNDTDDNSDDDSDSDSASKQGMQLLYLRVFPEHLAMVTQWERNPTSPRYGFPNMYLITFNDYRDYTGIGAPMTTIQVHWTRCIHIVDTWHCAAVNECFGVPRMRPVLNNILGLHKLYGGSPEMYWKGALPGLSLETHPQLGGDVEVDENFLRNELENYFGSLQRHMTLTGMSAKMLSPTVVDPTSHIQGQIEAVCITLACPKRVFMGSERGELASSQDDQAWNDRLRARQAFYITPRIIAPFINRLIMLGVLPVPRSTAPGKKRDSEVSGKGGDYFSTQNVHNTSKGKLSWTPHGAGKIQVNWDRKTKKGTVRQTYILNAVPPGQSAGKGGYAYPTSDLPLATDSGVPLPTAGPTSGLPSPHSGVQPSPNPPAPSNPLEPPPFTRLIPKGQESEGSPGFKVYWPDLTSQSKQEKATVANTLTTALAAYVSGGVQALIPPMDFLTHIIGLDESEATAILGSAEQMAQDQEDQAAAEAEAQGLPPPGQPGSIPPGAGGGAGGKPPMGGPPAPGSGAVKPPSSGALKSGAAQNPSNPMPKAAGQDDSDDEDED